MLNVLKTVAIWIWCFPQQLAGAIFCLISRARKVDNYWIISRKWGGSVSLGTWVFISELSEGKQYTIRHEFGHTKQSYILGWLYLLVIGLPSITWCGIYCLTYRWWNNRGKDYYWFYTEKWANRLAGLE